MEIISPGIGVASSEELAFEITNNDIVNNNTCAIPPGELAIDNSNMGLFNVHICAITSAQISTDTISNVESVNPDTISKMLDCKNMGNVNFDPPAVTNKQNADMLNLVVCATTIEDHSSEIIEIVSPDTCAITPEKPTAESKIMECVNSDIVYEQNAFDNSVIDILNTDPFAITTEELAIESSNIENISSGSCEITANQFSDNCSNTDIFTVDICPTTTEEHGNKSAKIVSVSPDTCTIISDQFAVDSEDMEIVKFDIYADARKQPAIDSSNMVMFSPDVVSAALKEHAIECTNRENLSSGSCEITSDHFSDDSSNIDTFNAHVCATISYSSAEEYENEMAIIEDVSPDSCVITQFAVDTENMEHIIFDTYDVTHEHNAIDSPNEDIFHIEISATTTEEHAIESSQIEDVSPDSCSATEQLLLDCTNMEIVNLGVCAIIPEHLAIIDLNPNLETMNPDTCVIPPDQFAIEGVSDTEIIPPDSKTPDEDDSMRYTQIYLVDFPNMQKMDLQYTPAIDVQEELLKAFSIPSSSTVESEFTALGEPRTSATTLLEYSQNIENQDELDFVVHPVPGHSTNESEAANVIERETLLEYSDDILNNREELQLPNLAASDAPVEPELVAMNEEEGGGTLLKYYQNIEDQLQFSDFADPNSSIDESEFLVMSGREDSATLNTEIPIDLADIRMESLIGSQVDKPPVKSITPPTVPRDKPYLCSVCGYQSSFRRRYTVHMRTHTGEKPFSCLKCGYKCSDTGTLNKHMRIHSKDKQLKCNACAYSCTEKSNLTKHILRHKGVKPFKCPDCRFTSAQSSDLKRHVLVHASEKPLTCISCNVLCPDQETLKHHLLTHEGEKTFSCSECEYSNPRLENLRRHMVSHRGGELYTCFYCKRPFITNLQLENHMRTHSTHKPFSCSECRYSCTLKSTLLKHRQTHVAKKNPPTLTLWVSEAVNE